MTRRTLGGTLLTAALLLACPALAHAQLDFSLDQTTLSAWPGSAVTFSGALSYSGPTDLYLNGDTFTLAGTGLTLDDAPFFLNFPAVLPGGPIGEAATGDVFTVALAPDVPAGDYAGTFTILGGPDANAQTPLATANFTVTAIPEPGALPLLGLGLTLLALGLTPALRRNTKGEPR